MPTSRSAIYLKLAEWLAPAAWHTPVRLIGDEDWHVLIEASSHHLVTPALGWRLQDADGVPAEVRDFFDAMLVLNRQRNQQMLSVLAEAGRQLNKAGIVPMLIKGSGLVAAGMYPDPGMRMLGDLDLLLPEAQLGAAKDILAASGFAAQADPLDHAERHQLPMMVHEASGVGIELHRHPITLAWAGLADAKGLLARGTALAIHGAAFSLPSANDRMVLAIAHGQIKDGGHQRGVPPLRAILDLALHWPLAPPDMDWIEIDRRFEAVGLRALLHDTLALGARLTGLPEPFLLGRGSRSAMRRLVATLDRPQSYRALAAFGSLLRSVPAALRRSPSEQVAALSVNRWRQRLARHHPRW